MKIRHVSHSIFFGWLCAGGLVVHGTGCVTRGPDTDYGGPDMATSQTCSDTNPCPMGLRCVAQACVPDLGPCCSDNDCENDSHCSVEKPDGGSACGYCVAYRPGEYDPMCQGESFSASDFKPPVEKCRWQLMGETPTYTQVINSPVVIDLDGDGKPEIIFATQKDNGETPANLVAIHGADCSMVYDAPAGIQPYAQLAAADLDGDGKPEIVGLDFGGSIVRLFNGQTGAELARSTQAYTLAIGGYNCSGPAIADVDGDGTPEIVVAAMVLRWNKAKKTLDTVWSKSATGSLYGALTALADMDGDGLPEVITGNQIFDGKTGAEKTPSVLAAAGQGFYPAVGDMNGDGAPDLVLVTQQRVMVVDVKHNTSLLDLNGVQAGGPPTVADFDGDGKPEFGSAGSAAYTVFSLDCLAVPKPAKCKGATTGILWQSSTKDASGSTGSSVFDFNGDGKAEVVYRDECWARVYNGVDGTVVFASSATSATGLELPVVADVDNDGHADLIVPSDKQLSPSYCSDQDPEPHTGTRFTGQTEGLLILTDPMNRWMPSRPLWNQHTYHITNVNDDGSVPKTETPNWTSYNNYRQNVQGKLGTQGPAGDLTGRGATGPDQGDCVHQWVLSAQICNRGSAAVAAMVPGTFYRTDPRKGNLMPICTAHTTTELQPGQCQVVSCPWMGPPSGPTDLWFRADDAGTGLSPDPECKSGNDLAYMPGAQCGQVPG